MLSAYWHTQEVPDILAKLNTNLDEGLTTSEVESRLKQYGNNDIASIRPVPSYQLVLRQFYSSPVVILLLAAVGLFLLERFEPFAFVVVILFANICLKYIKEFRINRQLELLGHQMTQEVKVLRDEQVLKVDALDIVPGDIIILGVGDKVPADARIIEANSLLIDESSLFIESKTPIRKNRNIVQRKDLTPDEIRNMAYAGTAVVDGSGIAVVTATGKDTELSTGLRLNHLSKNVMKADSQILQQMKKLRNYAIPISIGAGITLAAISLYIMNRDLGEGFELGMSFIISLSPASAVIIALSIMAYNAYEIFQHGAVVKYLSDFETLGKTTAFLTDEMSNFMNDEMAIKQIFVDGQIVDEEQLERYSGTSETSFQDANPPIDLPLLIVAADLSTYTEEDNANDARLMEKSINQAIMDTTEKIHLDREEHISAFSKIREIPYNPKRRRRNAIFEGPNGFFMFTIGDSELILPHCSYIQLHGQLEGIDNKQTRAISLVNQHFAENFEKVLAVSYRQLDAPVDESEILRKEREEVFLGLIALDAIIANDVKDNIKNCRSSGLKILMMTDSSKDEAFRTARRLGLVEDRKWIISRRELRDLEENEYSELIESILVYSELKPEDKTHVINQLQKKGHIVAAMGNQSSDADSLKTSDLGIAVKSQASGSALDACKLMLSDGSFNLITNVITQARETYYSIRNSIRWFLSCAIGQAAIILMAFLMQIFMVQIFMVEDFAMPLTLLQIVWINLLTFIPLIALSKDTITSNIVHTRPFNANNLLLSSYIDILVRGIVIALIALASFIIVYKGVELLKSTEEAARTVVCTVLVFTFLTYCFRCHRRPYETLIQRILVNRLLLMTVFISIGLQLLAIYVPPFNQLLGMAPIGKEWIFVGVFSLMGILLPLNMVQRN